VVKCIKSEKSKILSAISKKKVAHAVERNTIKRRIRAAFARFRPHSLAITVQPINVTGGTPYSAYEAAAQALSSSCSKLLNSKE
jgi:ribonuclease P protein component